MLINIFYLLFILGAAVFITKTFSLNNLHYIKDYKKITVYYVIILLIIIPILYPLFLSFLKSFSIFPVMLLGALYFMIFFIYYLFQRYELHNEKVVQQLEKRRWYYASFNYHYIFPKTGNILSQQILGVSLVSLLFRFGLNSLQVIVSMGILGIISHLFLLDRGKAMAIYFICAAFVAGIIFSIIVISVNYGFIYTIILHWIFYLFSGLILHFLKKDSLIEKLL